ncbi:peptidylprolyl isomerase [Aliiglaciecola sp. LCG003]|uniref:peptidylprolyl isomerase n=1 Tax=Aliiglaciecola sp. LCG003 TaxID=3053655 RepID=UPI002572B1D5|nr:peptidylprolyl isomerase [Aliiglaciecola sp. LCG003]WJG09011.1 peptidylprolyl isomerase [Aliiglaciecola sp. LCG003]
MRYTIFAFILFLLSPITVAKNKDDGSHIQPDNYYPRVMLHTTMGDITVELDRTRAPLTVNNFLRYVDKRSFEGTIFHRVIADFVVQGGGYDKDFRELSKFPKIYNESGNGLKNQLYTIAMARSNDEHSANRQFYFNLNDNESLDPGKDWGYAVFGYVTEGTDVLDAISQVPTQYDAIVGWADVPIEPVLLIKTTLLPPL